MGLEDIDLKRRLFSSGSGGGRKETGFGGILKGCRGVLLLGAFRLYVFISGRFGAILGFNPLGRVDDDRNRFSGGIMETRSSVAVYIYSQSIATQIIFEANIH